MKTHKIIALILGIILSCSFLIPANNAVGAEGQNALTLEFALTNENGKSVIAVDSNDVITVQFVMKRTDSSENYNINGFQNYIHYDLSIFEFVEDSIVCYDTGMATAKKMNSITYGEIIQCQNMAQNYSANFVFCSFKLRVIATEGSGTVYNDEVYAFDVTYQSIPVTKQNLVVTINSCTHDNKISVSAQDATCHNDGWEAYQYCEACGLIFNATGEDLIESIPYIPAGHKKEATLTYDNVGHWYKCARCDERFDYADHDGDVATCSSKAKCSTCDQFYGEIDADNHVESTLNYNEDDHWYSCNACGQTYGQANHSGGVATCNAKAKCDVCKQHYGEIDGDKHVRTYVINYRFAWFFGDGYSGDTCCSDCNQVIEMGKVISKFDSSAWPWWVLLLSIPLFPIIIIVWSFT